MYCRFMNSYFISALEKYKKRVTKKEGIKVTRININKFPYFNEK